MISLRDSDQFFTPDRFQNFRKPFSYLSPFTDPMHAVYGCALCQMKVHKIALRELGSSWLLFFKKTFRASVYEEAYLHQKKISRLSLAFACKFSIFKIQETASLQLQKSRFSNQILLHFEESLESLKAPSAENREGSLSEKICSMTLTKCSAMLEEDFSTLPSKRAKLARINQLFPLFYSEILTPFLLSAKTRADKGYIFSTLDFRKKLIEANQLPKTLLDLLKERNQGFRKDEIEKELLSIKGQEGKDARRRSLRREWHPLKVEQKTKKRQDLQNFLQKLQDPTFSLQKLSTWQIDHKKRFTRQKVLCLVQQEHKRLVEKGAPEEQKKRLEGLIQGFEGLAFTPPLAKDERLQKTRNIRKASKTLGNLHKQNEELNKKLNKALSSAEEGTKAALNQRIAWNQRRIEAIEGSLSKQNHEKSNARKDESLEALQERLVSDPSIDLESFKKALKAAPFLDKKRLRDLFKKALEQIQKAEEDADTEEKRAATKAQKENVQAIHKEISSERKLYGTSKKA